VEYVLDFEDKWYVSKANTTVAEGQQKDMLVHWRRHRTLLSAFCVTLGPLY
jgi:hypothetical protein